MCNISQSWDQIFKVNYGPRSEVNVLGIPKWEIQEKTKAWALAAADVSDKGIASIHWDVRSMTVKMKSQPPLCCKGPSKSMWRWEKRHWGMGIGCGGRRAWRWTFACWQWRQARPVVDVVGKTSPDKPRRHHTLGGSQDVKCCANGKNVFSALVTADMWVTVYRSTVYNTKGTTWSGSPPWKEAQQEVQCPPKVLADIKS